MNRTFHGIINKIILGANVETSENVNNENNEKRRFEFTEYNFVLMMHEKKKTKLNYLKTVIFDNIFYSDEQKENILHEFCKVQKVYYAFAKIARLYNRRKWQIKIECDLFLNPIRESQKNVIVVLQNKAKYLFTVNDLIKIIKNSISNTDFFFSEPLECRNPYNNMVFDKSILYNIYFFIKHSNFIMPQIFQNFFLCDFNLREFEINNQFLVREHAIEDYLTNMSSNLLRENILLMIRYCNSCINTAIKINSSFPTNKLIEIMKPYVKLYFSFKFTMCSEKREHSVNTLLDKFKSFADFNSNFGRKKIKIVLLFNGIKEKITYFDEKHVGFFEPTPINNIRLDLESESDSESDSYLEYESELESVS